MHHCCILLKLKVEVQLAVPYFGRLNPLHPYNKVKK
jgi:hypothetical protein